MEELHKIQNAALTAESFGPAAQANKQIIQLLDKVNQLDAEQAAVDSIPADPDDRDAQLLRELRRARAGARACSSWVAVSNLSTKEAELNAAQRARRKAQEARDMSDASEEQKISALTSIIDGLPAGLKEKVISALVKA